MVTKVNKDLMVFTLEERVHQDISHIVLFKLSNQSYSFPTVKVIAHNKNTSAAVRPIRGKYLDKDPRPIRSQYLMTSHGSLRVRQVEKQRTGITLILSEMEIVKNKLGQVKVCQPPTTGIL